MCALLHPAALVLLLLIGIHTATAADLSPTTKPVASADRVLPMAVTVNGVEGGVWLLVEHDGALYAPGAAFEEWRVLLNAEIKPINFKGQNFWPLSAIPGYLSKTNFANQSVELQFSPQAFAATRLAGATAKRPVVSPVLPSVMFSYDLNYTKSELRNAPSVEDLSALTEIGLSIQLGVLTSSAIARNLTGENALGTKRQWLRLETTFTKDLPDRDRTLRLGDSNTRAGMLGRNVYFGGIQYGSNFALTPGYVRQPLPSLTGVSAAPSTVELYINDVLRQVSSVPTGPFAIQNFPTLTGSGDARIVVRDQLGRETVIQQSFFTNAQLLASGLNDWSVEAGKVRRDLGTASANYGQQFVSGLWRHGFNGRLTLEGRTVVASNLALFGLGAVTTLPFQLLGRAALSGSHSKDLGSGTQGLLGVEHQGLRFGAAFEVQGASINYRDLGEETAVTPIKRQMAGNLSYASERLGSFGLGFASIRQYDSPAITTLSGDYSMRIGQIGNLTFTASHAQGAFSRNAIGVTLFILLGNNRVASANVNNSGNQRDAYVTYSQSPDVKNPLGWRLLMGQQQNQRHEEGGVNYLGQYGNLTGDVSNTPDQTALRLGASGGLLLAENHLFATRRLTSSFALAEVKDYGDVGVGIGSTMLTKTDSTGVALIPNLVAYQSNSIRLNAADLPVSAELDSIERDVVPAWRSGTKVSFPVRGGRGALLKIQLEDGGPAPAGAIVQIESDKQEFYVARRGEAFVTGLKPVTRVLLNWKQQQCKFDVALPPEKANEIPRLGPLLCKGLAR